MSTIVTRAGKGSALTHNEVDANFVNLNTDKVEKSGTDPVVIAVNSSSNALRITQTGTGNALVVEDSTSPDSTPFVVDSNGRAISGYTNAVTTGSFTAPVQLHSSNSTSGNAGYSAFNWNSSAAAAAYSFFKSRGSTIGTPSIVNSGDAVGFTQYFAYDGASWLSCASITASVDGTPGTNDMPGRLVFSTTADGASTPTERMRIRSDGSIAIGGNGAINYTLITQKNITGGVASFGIASQGQVQSDVTTSAAYFRTSTATAATAFTLPSLNHYEANQGTFGLGSTVNNQIGFLAQASLIGAINNIGFYGNIASGTGRWNFYAAGTAANYFAGDVGIGTSSPSTKLEVLNAGDSALTLTGNTASGNYVGVDFKRNTGTVNAAVRSQSVGGNDFGEIYFMTRPNAGSLTERMRIDSAGNINIATTGARITGDFSNATVANRVLFQSSTVDGATVLGAIPNGTNTTSAFTAYNNSNTTNSGFIQIFASSTDYRVNAGRVSVSGSFLPITFYAGGSERVRIDTSGNLLFNSGYGSVATAYGCRAWVNFNGTGTVAIRASGNVSSITDNGVGNYGINFTTAMPDANYAFSGSGDNTNNNTTGLWQSATARSTTTLNINTGLPGVSLGDPVNVNVAVFR